jgi:hypothetical protein
MKYYETHYDEYINSVEKYNIHPELEKIIKQFPTKSANLNNLIVYGPTGVGKYSQVLYLLKKYSSNELKYDKKITLQTDKQTYIYRISDIHYELDMSLLGCNSKLVWHEAFFQIVDIISVKQDKIGIIVCKNFHQIHTELLEIFYSYMQQYNNTQSNIKLFFIIITEHISFIPTSIINSCQIVNIGRPKRECYDRMVNNSILSKSFIQNANPFFKKITTISDDDIRISYSENQVIDVGSQQCNAKNILDNVNLDGILNLKEINYFPLLNDTDKIPVDIFNIICDNIIEEIKKKEKISFTEFRDTLYDILTYNLDVTECLWHILTYFINNNYLEEKDITDILEKTYTFLKYYNNNYRPIYHLESIMFYIVNKIHKYNEL